MSLVPSLSSTYLGAPAPLRVRMQRTMTATLVQAQWRGYQTRKVIAAQQEKEVAAVTPLWASLDEAYKLCVLCQNYLCAIHYNDPTWDAETSPYYTWMLTQGRLLDELEGYMLKRGWTRPPQSEPSIKKALAWMKAARGLYI